MATNLFRPPVQPNFQGDPYVQGGLRVWDDYQFRRKGIKGSGGGPSVPPIAVATPPVNVIAPAVTGLTSVSNTLNCDTGIWTGTLPIGYAYQWFWVAEVAVPTAPVNTSAPTASDHTEEGETITCFRGTWAGTTPIGYAYQWFWLFEEVPTAPSNSIAPHVSGSPYPERTLSCTTGGWIGTAPITYHYQWKRDAANIGTDSSTYFTVLVDMDALITCTVTAVNSVGSASVISNDVGPIVEAPPAEPLTDEVGTILTVAGEDLFVDA